MHVKTGDTIKTVYGPRKVVRVNAASVTVDVDGKPMRITSKQVWIMNGDR